MRAWLFLLGPFLLWGLHFGGVYAISSVFDVVSEADAPLSRMTVGGFSVACFIAAVIMSFVSARRAADGGSEAQHWVYSLGALGGALTALSVLWQGLPAVIGH